MIRRTNLATRPFYNVRTVQVLIGAFALVVIAFTLFNVFEVIRLRGTENALGSHAADNEAEAQRLRTEAAQIRRQIDNKELEAVSAAAREANAIIDRRAFSWTQLLELLEHTLPPDVRITTVQPSLEDGEFRVMLGAEARSTEDVADFIDALEKTGAFRDIVPRQESVTSAGLVATTLAVVYRQPPRAAGEEPAPDRDSEGGPQ
jgi:Tfp pilus assembly protein PilN